MANSPTIHATIVLPRDCLSVVTELIEKLGGTLRIDEASEYVVIPPMLKDERPGKMLRGLRLRAELTQAQLAEAIGVPESHILSYEKNNCSIPDDKARLLAEVLHTVPENFLCSTKGNL